MAKNSVPSVNPNADTELRRTQRPVQQHFDYIWEKDIFRLIGRTSSNMTEALSKLDPALKESFKQAIIAFSMKGDYAPMLVIDLCSAIGASMKRFNVTTFDTTWVSQAIKIPTFINKIGAIRNFFLLWKARDSLAISDADLQFLLKINTSRGQSSNILSDDPEKSWLSNEEYEALLASIWRNYEDGLFSTSRTLIALLSMQYARRPTQLSHLKIKDVRIALPGDTSGLSGPMISFPGAKDSNAETGYRDSKFEHHPLPNHLWSLFEIQRKEVRALAESKLGAHLTDTEIKELPLFTTADRLKKAASELAEHYGVDWRCNLHHQLFHMQSHCISRILTWKPSGRRDIEAPLSHRTGRPLVVSATRLRHTRARQLARKGVPLHVLSYWLGHASEKSLKSYYNDPAEDARKLDEAMSPVLMPLALAFAGNLIDSEEQASRYDDPTSRLEHASSAMLKNVGNCGKHSFCAATSVPIPCYRCRHFEPLVTAQHQEVLEALTNRQEEENQALSIGGARNLLVPINLSADIIAVQNCIDRCNARKLELGIT